MYQGYGGGGGGWNPWGGTGGGMNFNSQGQGQGQQQGLINQGQVGAGGMMQQFQTQQQQQANMMGYGANNTMMGNMGMMGYGGPVGMSGGAPANNNMMANMGGGMSGGAPANNNMMANMGGGMSTNNNNAAATGLMGMGMTGSGSSETNAHLLSMPGTPANTGMLGMNMGINAGNQYGNNQYANHQQQNQFVQQQSQQRQQNSNNSSQSLYQTQTSFARPQPPLPPGPPPIDQPSRDLSKQPLFNNIITHAEASTPVPPPPLPIEATGPKANNPPLPPPDSRNQHNIPDHLLKLLKRAEDARILESAENCPQMTPLMALNVSQDLFGTPSNSGRNKSGIPGLDFSDFVTNRDSGPSDSSKQITREEPEVPERVERLNFETMKSQSGDRKLDQKPSSEWNQFNRNNRTWRDNRQNEAQQPQNPSQAKHKEQPQAEIKWELRSEIANDLAANTTTKTELSSKEPTVPLKPMTETANHNKPIAADKISSKNEISDNKPTVVLVEQSLVSPSSKAISSAASDAESAESGPVAASIPLGSADGKPVEYDRRTLRAFDKKFREWEFQFENWKKSNDNHPDREAYTKYMDQWNLWRQQLIEQRRFILDKMNKARMEGRDISFQKNIAEDETVSKLKSTPDSKIKNEGLGLLGVGPVQLAAKPEMSPSSRGVQPERVPLPPPISNTPNKTVSSPFGANQPQPNMQDGSSTNVSIARSSNFNGPGPNSNKVQPSPPPLMSVSVELLDSNKKSAAVSTPLNTRPDRLVERIPRDKNRPDIQSKSEGEQSYGNNDPELSRGGDRLERISRNPHDQQNEPFKIEDKNTNPWALPNKPSTNPFDVAQNMQNPFVHASSQNPFAWNQASRPENNLPKLSDFLQNDTFSMSSQVPQHSALKNMKSFSMDTSVSANNRFGGNFVPDRVRREPGMSRNQMDRLEGIQFEQNPGGMPLLTATKIEPTHSEENESNDLSKWFTRDRRGGYEDEDIPEEKRNDYDDAPAVIDYGHGSGATNEEEEYDLPRGERPIRREPEGYPDYQDDEEENEPQDVVTIDYGHGSMPPHMGATMHAYPAEDDYYEEEYYDEYDNFQEYHPHMSLRGRGVRGRGRGGYPVQSGRGIGMYQSFRPPGPAYGAPPTMRPRGVDPNLRNMSRPFPNRGGGRGGPVRAPVFDSGDPSPVGYLERPLKMQPKPRPATTELETERVESPEIIILSPPSREIKPRVAPPRHLEAQTLRLAPRENFDERRIDRIPRDSSRGGREASRERDSRSRRNDRSRSREQDEPYRSRRDTSRDSEERHRSENRGRREDNPTIRRDRDLKDRYGRVKRLSRSRSRSPTFDRVAIYRNAPGGTSATQGSNNKGLNSAANPPPPRYQTVLIEDILNLPGRTKRPPQIVIILRGLPGSGKTHVAKLIKDREVEMGGSAPRIISLDDYFMAETEKLVKDPLTSSEVKETVMEYEYEPDMEPKYRNDLVKAFKKNVENTYFPFIIVDSVNDQVKHFEHMVSFATQKRFQVYVAEVEESVENCSKRNIHQRTKEQIQKIHRSWERTPSTCVKLDIRTLLQDEAVQDVEMEDVSDTENVEEVELEKKKEEKGKNWEDDEPNIEENQSGFLVHSKWDKLEPSEEKLNRLDGLARKRTTGDDDKVDSLNVSIDSWLQSHLPEDYSTRQQTRPGQKRVRWADIEERRAQERMRDVGFVVGHTDWNRMTDPSFGSSALTKTKYI